LELFGALSNVPTKTTTGIHTTRDNNLWSANVLRQHFYGLNFCHTRDMKAANDVGIGS